jgi:hypothetical protein
MKNTLVEQGLFMNVDMNRSEILNSVYAKKSRGKPCFFNVRD